MDDQVEEKVDAFLAELKGWVKEIVSDAISSESGDYNSMRGCTAFAYEEDMKKKLLELFKTEKPDAASLSRKGLQGRGEAGAADVSTALEDGAEEPAEGGVGSLQGRAVRGQAPKSRVARRR